MCKEYTSCMQNERKRGKKLSKLLARNARQPCSPRSCQAAVVPLFIIVMLLVVLVGFRLGSGSGSGSELASRS